MLVLLGEQLIRDPGIAVFELVKNSYDADATSVHVTLENVENAENGKIIIEDNGSGMDWETVVNVWLEPGTDYRAVQKEAGQKTPKFKRIPLGEKGVGRLAAHKLGQVIKVVSRKRDRPEIVINIDWTDFSSKKYLSDAEVQVMEREPLHFIGKQSGTRIEVTQLNRAIARGLVRQIHRAVTSISSPFDAPSDFKATVDVIPNDNQLAGLLTIDRALESAPYQATCSIEGARLTYDYTFTPLPGMDRVDSRTVSQKVIPIPDIVDLFNREKVSKAIGPILMELRIFDLDTQVLQYVSVDKRGLRDFIRFNGGIRVYRDGVRVYDYGEPGNDWLNLGVRRVNHPTRHVTSNQIVGAVHIRGDASKGLIEKTNREGFIEDDTFEIFQELVSFALTQIEFERNRDKERIRATYSQRQYREPVVQEVLRLKDAVERYPKAKEELLPLIEAIETQYIETREVLMTAAGAGLAFAVVIHEVEKGVATFARGVSRGMSVAEFKELAIHLTELMEGLTYLTRRSPDKKEKASAIIKHAIFNTNFRLKHHDVQIMNGIDSGDEDFEIRCTRRLVIATLMNLIDNSIFWLGTKGAEDKRIYIGTREMDRGQKVIFVADTGPGFQDPPDLLVKPFMTRRPDGTGLGLHIADEIMKAHKGALLFPTASDLGLPAMYSGAVVALEFPRGLK